nr:hypothetical protein [Tanacetum cinerariifolium]
MLLDFDFDEIPQIEPNSHQWTPLTQEEAEKWALAYSIIMRYEMLEEGRPMLKEKKDPGAFIFLIRLECLINENALADTGSDINTMPYRIYKQLGMDDIMKKDRNITMIIYTEAEVTGWLVNVMCQVGFTTLSAKFLVMEILVDRDALIVFLVMEILVYRDALIVVGCGFLDTIGGNIDIPNKILTTFDRLSRQTFRVARSEKIKIVESDSDDEEDYTSGAYDHEAKSSRTKCSRHVETVEEALLLNVHHEFLDCYTKLVVEEIDHILKISLKEAQSNEEIFFYVAWVRAFNIREPTYPELCREFYATYEFDEWTTGYEKIQKNDLWLLSMFEDRHQNGYENVAWVIAKWIKEMGLEVRRIVRFAMGDYNPPCYVQPQYDQYYHQYYPQQLPQQQHDDEENE